MSLLSPRNVFDSHQTLVVFRRLTVTLTVFISFTLTCLAQGTPSTVSVSFDFRDGALGWQAGFADYPPTTDENGFYQLLAEVRTLPAELGVNGTGFYIQGNNHSDDLFMFLKRRLDSADGIVAGQTYQISFTVLFASGAQSGCAGIGGSPGDSVALKAGASAAEPTALFDSGLLHSSLRMNVDKGNQGQGGLAASTTGTIANGIPCGSAQNSYVSVQRTHQHTSLVNANAKGELWLLIGTDSGFEGLTALYYQRIDVTLTPVSPPSPVLLTDDITGRASAMDSVTLMGEPFSVTSPQNFFSSDQRTRVTLFGYNLELKNGEGLSALTAQAEDSQHKIFVLPVEAAEEVPKFNWIKGITFKLPDELQGAGDVFVKVGLRGVLSNQVALSIK
jgi:hypothetical protein